MSERVTIEIVKDLESRDHVLRAVFAGRREIGARSRILAHGTPARLRTDATMLREALREAGHPVTVKDPTGNGTHGYDPVMTDDEFETFARETFPGRGQS